MINKHLTRVIKNEKSVAFQSVRNFFYQRLDNLD